MALLCRGGNWPQSCGDQADGFLRERPENSRGARRPRSLSRREVTLVTRPWGDRPRWGAGPLPSARPRASAVDSTDRPAAAPRPVLSSAECFFLRSTVIAHLRTQRPRRGLSDAPNVQLNGTLGSALCCNSGDAEASEFQRRAQHSAAEGRRGGPGRRHHDFYAGRTRSGARQAGRAAGRCPCLRKSCVPCSPVRGATCAL